MADDTFALPGTLSRDELLADLRNEEDLFFQLTGCRINPDTGENNFEFASTIYDDPPSALGDPDTFLKLHAFACAPSDAAACEQAEEDFRAFDGGAVVWFGAIRLVGVATFVVFYRGSDPEFPQGHVPVPADPSLPFIPEDARRAFDPGGVLADLPLREASTLRMSLRGLKDSVISYFLDGTGQVDALMMVTDADIDTDGPRGSTKQDPWYQAETSLRYPDADHTSCNSREFPGVVRSVHLREHFKLKLGDLAYIYYRGKAVACQVYDQGPDDKIGEISLYAARQAGVIPPTMSEADAARNGNRVKDLITLCFPGSCPEHRALPVAEINARAADCLRRFIHRLQGQESAPTEPIPQPIPVNRPAPGPDPGPLIIQPRSAWKALPPKVSGFESAPAQGIVIHNTQGDNDPPLSDDAEVRAAFALARSIQHSHMVDNHWSDIGQHFTISRGGIIMEGRAGTLAAAHRGEVVRGAHAGVNHYNRTWWGIEVAGDFRQDPTHLTAQQIDALILLCSWLGGFIGGFAPDDHVKAHRQVKPGGTDCPGLLLDPDHPSDFLTRLRATVRLGSVVASAVSVPSDHSSHA